MFLRHNGWEHKSTRIISLGLISFGNRYVPILRWNCDKRIIEMKKKAQCSAFYSLHWIVKMKKVQKRIGIIATAEWRWLSKNRFSNRKYSQQRLSKQFSYYEIFISRKKERRIYFKKRATNLIPINGLHFENSVENKIEWFKNDCGFKIYMWNDCTKYFNWLHVCFPIVLNPFNKIMPDRIVFAILQTSNFLFH